MQPPLWLLLSHRYGYSLHHCGCSLLQLWLQPLAHGRSLPHPWYTPTATDALEVREPDVGRHQRCDYGAVPRGARQRRCRISRRGHGGRLRGRGDQRGAPSPSHSHSPSPSPPSPSPSPSPNPSPHPPLAPPSPPPRLPQEEDMLDTRIAEAENMLKMLATEQKVTPSLTPSLSRH